jgi:3-(3-hydroxy-phenyl)propionate hydroxylase
MKLATGKTVRFDDVLGSGFALIAQNEKDAAALSKLTHPIWQQLKPSLIYLASSEKTASAEGPVAAVTAMDAFVRPILTHRDQIILVRPDRYVGGAFFTADEYDFAERFRQLLESRPAERMSA